MSESGAANQKSSGTTEPAGKAHTENDRPLPGIRVVARDASLKWLRLGWQDLLATRFRGLFYGAVFVAMGYAIVWIYATKWQLTMGLIGGFFLVGPFLCSGTYELSRQRTRGEQSSLPRSMVCWKRSPGTLALFAFILTFSMIVWARVSLIVFALFSDTSFPTLQGVLSSIFSIENWPFLLVWLGVGFVFASLVFSISVISAPMMLDRNSDTFSAVFSSVRCVVVNPGPLYTWAAIVVMIIGVSLLLGFLPLLVTAPLIGHASWHAYVDLVEPEPAVEQST